MKWAKELVCQSSIGGCESENWLLWYVECLSTFDGIKKLKLFNCSLPVLSLCFFLPLSLTCCINTLVCRILLWSNQCPSPQCFFYTGSGWLKFAYVTNPIPPETKYVTYKLHSQRRSCFRFSILLVLYTQDTFTPFPNFEVGHFAHYFLFLSFGVAMKEIQFTQLHCHISFLLFTQLTTCFLSSCRQLLNSCKCWLFHLHIQHDTRCLFK